MSQPPSSDPQESSPPLSNAKFRASRRLSEMSAQESLISKKKAEIQDRLNAKLKKEEESEESSSSSTPAIPPPSPVPPVIKVNKFANDGSFMEAFLRLKNAPKEEKEEDDTSINETKGHSIESVHSLSTTDTSSRLLNDVEVCPSASRSDVGMPHSSSSEEGGGRAAAALSQVAEELASMVAVSGDQLEEVARMGNTEEDELSFLYHKEGDAYQSYRRKVDALRSGIFEEHRQAKEGNSVKKRKSRWGDENDKIGSLAHPEKSKELLQYAVRVFGSMDLEPHQWRQCEDQLKMNIVYEDILKKQEDSRQAAALGKHKYEYDSDEDIEGGTWEHKARKMEMDKTLNEADKLTESGAGKHHIGDFLPPEELSKFMAKYQAMRDGKDFNESDYADNKLTEENKGFKLLQKMGWSEGVGLGSSEQGITAPISNNGQGSDKKGLGVNKPHELEKSDNEFDAYRKRMMMAYRFRPNFDPILSTIHDVHTIE